MLSKSLQRSAPIRKEISQIESVMIEKEVEDVLTKGVITSVNQEEDQFLRTFLVPKKDGYQRSMEDFKMEDLLRFKKVLLKGNYMHKLDLQDAYFLVPLNKKSRKYVRFLWSNNLYEFMCLCFGLGSAP